MERLLTALLKGNSQAVALCLQVFEWANDYDDLEDGDGLRSTPDYHTKLHDTVWFVAHTLPRNPFFRTHQDELGASFTTAVSSWRISNALQRGASPHGHQVAHVLRWGLIEFFLHCARIIGGEAWVQRVGPQFWMDMTQDHSFEQFAAECGQGG